MLREARSAAFIFIYFVLGYVPIDTDFNAVLKVLVKIQFVE